MKPVLLVLIFLISCFVENAQFRENNDIYYTGELYFGNYIEFNSSLHYVHRDKYSIQIGVGGFIRKPKSQPDDYSAGLIKGMLFGFANPYDQVETFQIGVGKIYANKRGTARGNISFGLGYTAIKEIVNWEKQGGDFFLGNYTWDEKKYKTMSFIINPRIEFPLSRIVGFAISSTIQINKHRTVYGIGVVFMIGML